MKTLTASLEDYLEIICNYATSKKKVRAIDISKELNISRASVSEALKKLTTKGYINHERYDSITLTSLGLNTAQKIISKHLILKKFFEKTLGLSKEEANLNACKIEHVITDNAFLKISEYLDKQGEQWIS